MQSNMGFTTETPLNDVQAEQKIAQAYRNDPGASPNGTYITAEKGITMAAHYPDVRVFVVGCHHHCPNPIPDFYPSVNDSRQCIAHGWAQASPSSIGSEPDVMGSRKFSATCWYFGMELYDKIQVEN